MAHRAAQVAWVRSRLATMKDSRIWPNGLRYLWTDAFGLTLYVSLYEATKERVWLTDARWLIDEVVRVLGRQRGFRIGEAADRDGQYYHYLAMWMSALALADPYLPGEKQRGLRIAKDVHAAFVTPRGVWWKMKEDLSGPHPSSRGFGSMDAFDGYVAYRLLDPRGEVLGREISEMHTLMQARLPHMEVDQDLGEYIALPAPLF